MALFNFPYAQYGEAEAGMQPILKYLKCALREAGHDVYLSPHAQAGGVNILIESFDDVTGTFFATQAKQGMKFAIVATEIVTGSTFNDIKPPDGDVSIYCNRPVWDTRYRNFMKMAQACKNVWCLSQVQLESYATVLPREWLHLLPFGYVEGFALAETFPPHLQDIDFTFIGTPTLRRNAILSELRKKSFSVAAMTDIPAELIQTNILARTKIGLSLRPMEGWSCPDVMSAYLHLMNGVLYLAEAGTPGPLDDYLTFAPPDAFVEACVTEQKDLRRAARAKENLDRFRVEQPLQPLFKDFLSQALA